MQIETAHPILFLSDSSPLVSIPDNAGEIFATATSDCLCFCGLSFVDGATLVTITDQNCEGGGAKFFCGTIDVPSGVATLSDSSSFRYVNIPVPPGPVSIEVWADNDQNPDWVWVKLGAIRAR
ncbi:hypothetical protein [Mesorhizobium sp. M1163]